MHKKDKRLICFSILAAIVLQTGCGPAVSSVSSSFGESPDLSSMQSVSLSSEASVAQSSADLSSAVSFAEISSAVPSETSERQSVGNESEESAVQMSLPQSSNEDRESVLSPVASSQQSSENSETSSVFSSMNTASLPDIYSADSEDTPMTENEVGGEAPVLLVLEPTAPGKETYGNDAVTIDVSNRADGYIMIRYKESTSAVIKAIVQGPSGTKYTYNLSKSRYEVLPLSDGNGTYTIGIYKNIEGTKYSVVFTQTISVSLKDEFAPFLYPNQYVNFSEEMQTVKKAAELTKNCRDRLSAIQAVYTYVIDTLSYDKERAATVQSGYLPNLDDVLAKKKGICFDYAALMTAMLRSLGIPTKLVVGYSGKAYHAWISTYSDESGWVTGVIYFDGKNWKLMDPTYASSGKSSDAIMEYIGNGSNYTAKYLY